MKLMQIGEVSRLSGLPVRTVHYYEDRGLLEPASHTEAGYRLYGREELAQLRFISRAKLLGLTLEETRKLVALAEGCNRGEIVPDLEETLREKLRETERKMEELSAFKENLLYYERQLSETGPAELCGEEASFCGCVDAVTGTDSED
ncbi:MerR family transcriptional regulator [Rubrobacter aplysinae]|uniref:MerR family transcriptional regulator n=1 Tax=Rubrobacter aplysinae TaxID=909625 RepID=UPI00069FDE89|nr:MerR family transcriptional regulator [Rubrobacter aplysinae]